MNSDRMPYEAVIRLWSHILIIIHTSVNRRGAGRRLKYCFIFTARAAHLLIAILAYRLKLCDQDGRFKPIRRH